MEELIARICKVFSSHGTQHPDLAGLLTQLVELNEATKPVVITQHKKKVLPDAPVTDEYKEMAARVPDEFK